MQMTFSLWERALSELLGLLGRRVSIEVAAPDGWTVGSFGGVLEHVEVVTMRGGCGGEDARLHFAGPFDDRLYLSEPDLEDLHVDGGVLELTTSDVVVRLAALDGHPLGLPRDSLRGV